MNKPEFLHILREKLSILDEKELEDILNEYEQHIDMKAAGAMTEEAAIADFGDIDELTAEILEAYHVRADFAQKKTTQKENRNTEALADSIRNAWQSCASSCKKYWKQFLDAMKTAGNFFDRNLEKLSSAITRIFSIYKKPKTIAVEAAVSDIKAPEKKKLPPSAGRKREEKREKMERSNRITLFTVVGAICRGCANALCWCGKAIWNVVCVCLGVMTGLFAFFCIFILGTLVVLLLTGYPLLGLTLAFLGLTMCACSVALLFFTLVIRHKAQEAKAVEKEETEPDREGEIANA